jgi:hypothetical protein
MPVNWIRNLFVGRAGPDRVDFDPIFEGMSPSYRRDLEKRKEFLATKLRETLQTDISYRMYQTPKSDIEKWYKLYIELFINKIFEELYSQKLEHISLTNSIDYNKYFVEKIVYAWANHIVQDENFKRDLALACLRDDRIIRLAPLLVDGGFDSINREFQKEVKINQVNFKRNENLIAEIELLRKIIRESEAEIDRDYPNKSQHDLVSLIYRIEACQRKISDLKAKIDFNFPDSWEDKLRTG